MINPIFEYTKIEIPDCTFKISPSSIGKFFNYPKIWYEENVLGKKEFVASTSTVLGTIVHAVAETYVKGIRLERPEIDAYITHMAKSQPIGSDPIMVETIKDCYPDMAMTLINDYIRYNKPTDVETSLYTRVLDDVFIGGTCDNRTGDTIVDYKTHSSATEPKAIPWDYKIQALAYAYMYRAQGIEINRIRIVYVNRPIDTRSISEKTGKPIGKITPPRVTVLTETITEDDWTKIQDTLTLIAETIIVARQNPALVHLLFKSMSLKEL